MLQKKLQKLSRILKEMKGVVVAFSGGTDSTFLLKAAGDVLKNRALAVTAASETYPEEELRQARAIARKLKVRHIVIRTAEWQDSNFRANPVNRCYHCKKELFRKLKQIAEDNKLAWVADGSTGSDETDFRPGKLAAKELGVRHPLLKAGLLKNEIRVLSRRWKLPTAAKPSSACLASRIPYGTPLTEEKIKTVGRTEAFLRKLGIPGNVRVRHHGETGRIELDPENFPKALENRAKINAYLKKQGFRFVVLDLDGYRTGSLNPDGKKHKTHTKHAR